jgi:large subunit ribosomal protein L16
MKKQISRSLKKMQKGRIRGTEINRRLHKSDSYAVKSLSYGRITEFQMESVRKVLKRTIKKKGQLFVRVHPYHTLTKKSAGVRMGKGKGKVDSVVYPIRPGKIILELKNDSLTMEMARKMLRQAIRKFGVSVSIIRLKD